MGYRIWGHRPYGYYVILHQYPDGTWHDLALFGDDALIFEDRMESVNDRYTLADLIEDYLVGHPSSDLCYCEMAENARMVRDGYKGHKLLYWGD
jgi:predicted HAD superfamily phosphohydrolase